MAIMLIIRFQMPQVQHLNSSKGLIQIIKITKIIQNEKIRSLIIENRESVPKDDKELSQGLIN